MSRFCSFALALILPLSACGAWDYSGPTTAEIEIAFSSNRADFDEIEAMLRDDRTCLEGADTPDAYAIEVGVDKVCGFWKRGRRWDQYGAGEAAMNDVSRTVMLREVGLPRERYELYLSLLDRIGARRARLYTYGGRPAIPTYWVGGAGMVTSSYYVNIVHLPAPPETVVEDVFAYIDREGYGTYTVYSELSDGWYVEMDMMW